MLDLALVFLAGLLITGVLAFSGIGGWFSLPAQALFAMSGVGFVLFLVLGLSRERS